MPPTQYSRRRFLSTAVGLSLTAQPLIARESFQSGLTTQAPTPWRPELKAPMFMGALGEQLFQPGTLTFVADQRLVGPMDFGMNMVKELAIDRQLPTVVFDYRDHNTWRLESSLTALQTGIDYGRIYFWRMGDATRLTDYELDAVRAAEKAAAHAPLGFFFRNSRIGRDEPYPEQLLDLGFQKVFEKAVRRPPALIVVNDLESNYSGGTPHYHPSLARFLSSLKSSAEFYGAAVIVGVTRMRTAADSVNDDCCSKLSHIADVETILPHADAVILVRHDQYFTATGRRGIVDIIVAHNRNGPTGTVEVAFAEKIGMLSVL